MNLARQTDQPHIRPRACGERGAHDERPTTIVKEIDECPTS